MKVQQQRLDPRAGFTLIEMLVTLSLFSLTLGSLVVGLRSGATTWERVHNHQEQSAATERALKIFAEDVRHMALLSEDLRPLTESQQPDGTETLAITTLGRRDRQAIGFGEIWSEVRYEVTEPEDGASANWVRRATRFVSATPFDEEPRESVLLSNVSSVAYSYFDGQSVRQTWDEEERWPLAIDVDVRLRSGKSIHRRVLWPVAWLNGGRL